MAAQYGNKTCYDCGIRKPANHMERVTESYNSGRSDTKLTAGNAAGFLFTDSKTSKRAVKRAILGNNRRSYTRNRTVWKCKDCSGTNDYHRAEVAKDAKNARKLVANAARGGFGRKPKVITEEMLTLVSEIEELVGTTSSQTSQDKLKELKSKVSVAAILQEGAEQTVEVDSSRDEDDPMSRPFTAAASLFAFWGVLLLVWEIFGWVFGWLITSELHRENYQWGLDASWWWYIIIPVVVSGIEEAMKRENKKVKEELK